MERDKFMLMLLMASGADVVAEPVKNQQLKSLGLHDDVRFEAASNIVAKQDEKKKLTFIKGLVSSHLTPSQAHELLDYVVEHTTKTLEFIKEHPQYRKKVDAEEVIGKLFSD